MLQLWGWLDMNILQTLLTAQHDLGFLTGCTATDMPDLPLSAETSWVIDADKLLKSIDEAIRAITGDLYKCSGCGLCSTDLLMVPAIDRPKHSAERSCSCTASRGSL